MDKFKKYIQLLNGNHRFTILLGSGIHEQAGLKDSILSSWNSLLEMKEKKSSDDSNKSTNLYNTILFEKKIIQRCRKQKIFNAKNIEKEELERISKVIKKEQDRIIKSGKYNYPLAIFNSKNVSDVVSLNFDLIVETLLNNNLSLPKCSIRNISDGKSIRSREINHIRFWHPHGDIEYPNSIQLGLRKYGLMLKTIESMRKEFKSRERITGYKNKPITNWFEALMINPVLVLGAGLSFEEWDVWKVLIDRERNYAKEQNAKNRPDIFILSDNTKSHRHIPKGLPFILLNTEKAYKDGWNKLTNILREN